LPGTAFRRRPKNKFLLLTHKIEKINDAGPPPAVSQCFYVLVPTLPRENAFPGAPAAAFI
jgi:hypothetical protein